MRIKTMRMQLAVVGAAAIMGVAGAGVAHAADQRSDASIGGGTGSVTVSSWGSGSVQAWHSVNDTVCNNPDYDAKIRLIVYDAQGDASFGPWHTDYSCENGVSPRASLRAETDDGARISKVRAQVYGQSNSYDLGD